jgi:hypothetical protein
MNKTTKRLLVTLVLALFTTSSITAKQIVVPKMYMFGFAAAFTDTIVYFTDIVEVDSAWIESKNKFLQGRTFYSRQLREYLSKEKQMPQRTCVVVYSTKRKKAEKKLLKMKRLYTLGKDGKPHFDVRYLTPNEFKFQTVNMADFATVEGEDESEAAPSAPAKGKAAKKPKGKKKANKNKSGK